MPQVIPALASAVATVAGAVSTVSPFLGTVLVNMAGIGVASATPIAAAVAAAANSVILNSALGALSPKPKVGSTGLSTQVIKDPLAPRQIVMGRMATAGALVFAKTHGPRGKHRSYVLALSEGPVGGITGLRLGDENLTWDGAGNVGGRWANRMRVYTRTGTDPQTAISLPVPPWGDSPVSEWTSNHQGRGVAHAWWAVEYDQNLINGLASNPIWIVDGYQGADLIDPRTGAAATGAARSLPHVWAYSLERGIRSPTGVKKFGFGHAPESIDIAAYAAGAAEDALLGRTVAGVLSAADTPKSQLAAVLAAAGSVPIDRGGLASVMRGTVKTSVLSIDDGMVVGALQEQPLVDVATRPNGVIPTYRSEAHGWQMVAADLIQDATYRTDDGEDRIVRLTYDYVSSVNQAAQLAALNLVHSREERLWVIPCNRRALAVRIGEAVTLNISAASLVGVKGVVEGIEQTPMGAIILTVRSETDAKYDWALTRTGAAPSTAVISQEEPGVPAPADGFWTAFPALLTQPGSTGAQVPVLSVIGTFDTGQAERIVVSYRLTGTTQWYEHPSVERNASNQAFVEISGLRPGGTYEVRVNYIDHRGVRGPERTLSSVTLGGLRSGSTASLISVGGGPGGTDFVIPGSTMQSSLDEIAAARRGFGALLTSVSDAAARAEWANVSGRPITLSDLDAVSFGRITTLEAQMANTSASGLSARIATEEGVRASADSALAVRATTLEAQMANTSASGLSARIETVEGVNVTQGSAIALVTDEVAAIRTSPDGTFASAVARINADRLARVNGDSALATRATTLEAQMANTSASGLSARIATVESVNVTQGAAIADTETVLSVLGGSVSVRASAMTTIAGLNSRLSLYYGIKLDGSGVTSLELMNGAGLPFGGVARLQASRFIIDAATIDLGDNTTFDDATNTFRTTGFPGGRVRIISLGPPFGASGDLLEWYGPAAQTALTATEANGIGGQKSDFTFFGSMAGGGNASGLRFWRDANNNGTSGASTVVAEVNLGPVPNGVVNFKASSYTPTSGTGTASYRALIERSIDGGAWSAFATHVTGDQLINGGTPEVGLNIPAFFQTTSQGVSAGSLQFRLVMVRTAGTGDISTSNCVLDVEYTPS